MLALWSYNNVLTRLANQENNVSRAEAPENMWANYETLVPQ